MCLASFYARSPTSLWFILLWESRNLLARLNAESHDTKVCLQALSYHYITHQWKLDFWTKIHDWEVTQVRLVNYFLYSTIQTVAIYQRSK